MTNLLATIIFTVTTNWNTISVETPYIDEHNPFNLALTTKTLHQTGTAVSNIVARLEWKGSPHDTLLEVIPFGPQLKRDIQDESWRNLIYCNALGK